MRVLAISQVYAPDHSAVAQLLTQLLEDLVGLGADVSVIASSAGYLGGGTLPARETLRGVRVVRPWATSLGRASIPRRLADYGSFWTTSVGRALVETRPDVLLALTTPPMIAAGVLGVAKLRRIPFAVWVQDVYPDIPIKFGMIREGSVPARGLRLLQRQTYRAAARIVGLSEGMAARLRDEGAPASRVRVIQNWADGNVLRPLPLEGSEFRREHALDGRFVAMYSGNLGVGHDVETFIGAARVLANADPRVVLVFVGGGVRRQEAEDAAQGLENVRFLPYQPEEMVGRSLAAADAHLISLREDLEGLLVPSKLYAAMAVGRPIMFVGPATCEVASVVQRFDLGWSGRPGDAGGLAAALTAAAASPNLCAERGARSRAAFERYFDRPIATRAWHSLLEEAARSPLRKDG